MRSREFRSPGSALAGAVIAASRAPSLFHGRPWRWRLRGAGAELWADPSERPPLTDPTGRLMVVGCGPALHYATVAMTAAGYAPMVTRFPAPDADDLLARVRAGARQPAGAADLLAYRALFTGIRPAGPAGPGAVEALRAAGELDGVHLRFLSPNQVVTLVVAAGAFEADRAARYAILTTDADTPDAWLRAGEAAAAVLLTAERLGLCVTAMSSVTELPTARELLRELLADGGHPILALRMAAARAPRRRAEIVELRPALV